MKLGKRIWIIGVSGSGKSTLTKKLSMKLNIPFTELDGVFWQKNWVKMDVDSFREHVKVIASKDSWIIDGQYANIHNILKHQATTIIWLDFKLRITFFRVLKRTFLRWIKKEVLWNQNKEEFLKSLDLFMYSIRNHSTVKSQNERLFKELQGERSVTCIRITTIEELDGL
ncbi:ATP-binding cassette domain-containing protein [Oceanobacillus sp. CFH 90083]|uniref:ATP-binding cassette domain-containing protein n=1 Tax=Oceanobacillus sp. CFH 90083 TaxID=2592336 RepID=UPI00128D5AD2|nr:ATP-binding cassette domain-containing protein [Oceanobacillus sp. CFH 90083]